MISKTLIPLLIAASLLLGGCQSKQDSSPEATTSKEAVAKASLTVSTIKPQQTALNKTLNANGNIAAWQESSISTETNGLLLREVLVGIGDQVKRGQVLARFAAASIEAEVAQTQANVAEAQATLIEAAGNANRARSIQDSGALSRQQIEQYITVEASAKARLDAAQANLRAQHIKLKQATVTAPDDGIISQNPATVGTVYAAGQELFRLIRKGRIEWRAELTSSDVSFIKAGMQAQITLPDGATAQGRVRTIAPSVDNKTRNAIVYVDMPAGSAKIGMFARGQFLLGNTDSLTLPNDAIVMRDGFAYVMQVHNNKITQTKVQLGQRAGDQVELLNFNAANAEIVASGGAFLTDGDRVRVVNKSVVNK